MMLQVSGLKMICMAFLSLLLFTTTAGRTLLVAEKADKCTWSPAMEDTNLPGKDYQFKVTNASPVECQQACDSATVPCNSVVYSTANKVCWMKYIKDEDLSPTRNTKFESYRCSLDTELEKPCTDTLFATNLNQNDPHQVRVKNVEEDEVAVKCQDECVNGSKPCNAVVYYPQNKVCFLKTISLDPVQQQVNTKFQSYICDKDYLKSLEEDNDTGSDGKCGDAMTGVNLSGGEHEVTLKGKTVDDCKAECEKSSLCNAFVYWSKHNRCWLKLISTNPLPSVDDPDYDSYLCTSADDGKTPVNSHCDLYSSGTHIVANNDKTVSNTETMLDCINECKKFSGCTSAVRQNTSGKCWLKKVPVATAVTERLNGYDSYLMCDPSLINVDSYVATAPIGKLGDTINFDLIPVAIAALPEGKVLLWSGDDEFHFNPGHPLNKLGVTHYAVYDVPNKKIIARKDIDLNHDMFCPGIAISPQGEIVVVGGSAFGDGAGSTSLWDPDSGSIGEFSSGPGLQIPRGYNTAVTMASGEIFTLGGSFSGDKENMSNRHGEFLDGNPKTGTWVLTPGIQGDSILSDDPQGAFRTDNYVWLFPWKDDSLLHAGPSKDMHWLDVYDNENQGSITPTTPPNRGPTGMNGNAVMYDTGKILCVGGGASYSYHTDARVGAEIITLGDAYGNLQVESVEGPNIPRTMASLVVLPTGEVVVFGGSTEAWEFSDTVAVLSIEVWDPITKKWSMDALLDTPRTYHSGAVLLPSGEVFLGGGGLCGDDCPWNHPSANVYYPKYLFKPGYPKMSYPSKTPENNELVSRPSVKINNSEKTANVDAGDRFTLTSTETLSMVAMVRMGTSTHSLNSDQRRLELCGPSSTPCSGASVQLTVPELGVTIAGPWMVFGMNKDGVPSEAAMLTVVIP